MTGTTVPDGLPFPDDYEDAADSPTVIEALAQATQTALTNRDTAHSPAGHGHASVPYADTAGNANALGGVGPGGYSGAGHGHNPSGVGIRSGQYTFTALGAGAEQQSGALPRTADERVIVCVNHASTYIAVTVMNLTASSFEIKVRNTTGGTTHTNIAIPYLLVRSN